MNDICLHIKQVKYSAQCMEKTVEALKKAVPVLCSMSRPDPKSVWGQKSSGGGQLRAGEWVEVKYDYAPGVCSDGGAGLIKRVHAATGGGDFEMALGEAPKIDVEYILDGRLEKHITLERVTVIPMPYTSPKGPTLRVRKRAPAVSSSESNGAGVEKKKSQLEWLKEGLKSRKHCKKGWLKGMLIREGEIFDNKISIWKRVLSDYKCQQAAIEGMQEVMGKNFVDPPNVCWQARTKWHLHFPAQSTSKGNSQKCVDHTVSVICIRRFKDALPTKVEERSTRA